MYNKAKIVVAVLVSLKFLASCSEECDSKKFSSYCDGNTIVYCAYDGGIENTSKQTVIYEECSDSSSDTPFCIEVQSEKDPELRASCVISKAEDPNCSAEDPFKFYCIDTARHKCYYNYTKHVSSKGVCSE
jgi:hypothetical protein